jgi:uncharacterized protein (TIGR02246 family)
MKVRSFGGILVFAVAIGFASAAVAEDGGAKSVDAAWVKAMKANDLDAIVACYASDGVMWFPGAPEARGTAAIRAVYAGYLAEFTVSDAVLLNASYATSGDVSGAWGDYILTLAPKKGGAPEVLKGRFTSVSKKAGGKWAYVADQASATPPPPPPAAK